MTHPTIEACQSNREMACDPDSDPICLSTIRNPKGLHESSRWSESAETTGNVVSHDRTPKGCQTSQEILLVKFDTRRVEKLSQFINKRSFTMMRLLRGNVAPH